MTLENMRYLMELNNKQILERMQNLKVMIDILMESGVPSNGTGGLYSDEEVETAIADTIKILGETTSDEEIQLAITDTIKILNEEVTS